LPWGLCGVIALSVEVLCVRENTGNPMGSIFDEPDEEQDANTVDPMPYDPIHGPLSSGLNWEQATRPGAGHEGVLDEPRGQFATSLPANEEFLICVAGPCRHYGEYLAELDSASEHVLTEVNRVCTGFGETRTLTEGTCFACTHYAPPSWSLAGWRRRVISAHRIGVGRRRYTHRKELRLTERVVEVLYGMVKGDAPELPRPQPQGRS
jgi:hypothetical protein